MKKIFRILATLLVILTAVASSLSVLSSCSPAVTVRSKTEWGLFDSYLTLMDYSGGSEEDFARRLASVKSLAAEYDRLYDVYEEHDGTVNLATVNREAEKAPVRVDEKIIDLLIFSREIYTLTGGETDVTMGPVLKIWHDHRTEGVMDPGSASLPDMAELSAAAELVGMDGLVIDEGACTVYFARPGMRLDVGAVAKGYATERLAEWLEEDGAEGYVIDFGGNLRAVGRKPGGEGWQSGVRNPDVTDYEHPYVHYFELADGSAVTSGDYERYYTVGGVRYHHIIDGDTLMPAAHFASVTVLCRDSGLADGLSTALFNMTLEEGQALIDSLDGVECVWVCHDRRVVTSEN